MIIDVRMSPMDFGLAGGAFHGGGGEAADAETGTEGHEASAEAGAEIGESGGFHREREVGLSRYRETRRGSPAPGVSRVRR